jgi:DNA repair exonuclease SbcCD nuclease subunit
VQWNPKPVPDALNIIMFHNSITPYIYSPLEPPSMRLEDLPKGFDLYVLGHMHWHDTKILNSGQLLLCGSTIPTSLHKIEAEQQKCIYKYNGSIQNVPLENQRKIIWEEFEFSPNIKNNIETFVGSISADKIKPIINIKVKGLIKKDTLPPNFSEIEEKYKNKAIVNINKDLEAEDFQDQIEMLRSLKDQKLTPEEHGLKILQENLKQMNCGIKIDEIFDYLIEGDVDLIFNILTGNQQTLKDGLNKWTA